MRLRPLLPSLRPAPLASWAVFGVVLAATTPARAEPISANYEVFFGGLHVLNAEAQWELGTTGYHLTAEAETEGFIGWLNPWKGTTETRGHILDGKVIPEYHENWGTDSDEDAGERLVELRYNAQGDITKSLVQPEQNWEDHYPLPADAGKGTMDPLSVIAGITELLQDGGRCEGTFPVFDGRKRYDLIVSDAGDTVLEPTDYSIYAGPAHGCRLDYKMLGGQRKDHNKYVETAHNRIVWVARPAEDAPLIPVRLSIETDYGTVMGHLTGFARGAQAQAKLAE